LSSSPPCVAWQDPTAWWRVFVRVYAGKAYRCLLLPISA